MGNVGGASSMPLDTGAQCCGGNRDLMLNMILILCFCAFEAVLAMLCGAHTLFLNFYHRLGYVFALVYSLEAVQSRLDVAEIQNHLVLRSALPEINSCTNPIEQTHKVQTAALALAKADGRRRVLAALLISCYLLAVAFSQAMANIVSMYGGAPPAVIQPGWIFATACLLLLLDLVHWYYKVEMVLGMYANEQHSCWTSFFLYTYGSWFVMLEGCLCGWFGGSYTSPILAIVYAGVIAWQVTDNMTIGAHELLSKP